METGSRRTGVRTARLLAATSLGFGMALLAATPAAAQLGCSVPTVSGAVTCDASGNPYALGITQIQPVNLSLTTTAGVVATGVVTGTGLTGSVTANNAGTLRGGTTLTAGGAGGVTVVNTGIYGSSTANQAGLRAVANTGAVNISGSGSYSTGVTSAPALSVSAFTTATLALGNVTSSTTADGVAVTANTSSTITLNGVTTSAGGAAVRVTGGAATITNSAGATLTGSVVLTGNNDSFTNAGLFQALADSNFGAGTDTFTNTGILRVRPNAGPVTTVTLTGLETFNNSGTVSLLNNRTGDRLIVPGAFVGSGASTVQLDIGANFTGAADVLQTGPATGTTFVQLNTPIGTVFTPSFGAGPVVVQAATGTSPTAFTLSPNQVGTGFVNFALAYDPAAFTFSVVGVPSIAIYRLARVVEGQRALWYRSSDTLSAHLATTRDALDAGVAGGRLWGSFDGSEHSRRGPLGATAFGVARTFSTSYRQDLFEGMIGFDVLAPTADGGFSAGVMGGYSASTLRTVGSLDRVYYHVVTGGAYAGYAAGAIFANATGRYQKSWNSLRSSAGFATNAPDGELYGAAGEVGIRIKSGGFFFEPVASIDYVHAKIDGFAALGATVAFDEDDGFRGKAGARAGTTMPLAGGTATIYVSGEAVRHFQSKDIVFVTTGTTTAAVRGDRPKTYGHGKFGFSVATPGGVTGFVEGFGDYGDDYRGGGGRAGLAIKF